MINSGQLVRFQIGGIDFDPVGDWTVRESGFKYENTETTRNGVYFSKNPKAGMISGSVQYVNGIDYSPLLDAESATVIIEGVGGDQYQGTVTYTADGDISINDGKVQVELYGIVTKL